MRVYETTVVGQYGTHVDIPVHFDPNGRTQEQIRIDEMVYPLCVIDKSEACRENPDYQLTVADVEAWEASYGQIPEGAFVAFRSDWYKRDAANFDNNDETGKPHYPGWALDTLKFLVEERHIGAIGHETADTDPAVVTSAPGQYPFPGEQYILMQDRIQIEVMAHLDEVPAAGAIIFCTFPKLKGGTGFSARCFALVAKD